MTVAEKSEPTQANPPSPSALYVYFRVRSTRCCMPAADVDRVADIGQINGLPRLPGVILGICSERGRVLTVIDAAQLLGCSHDGQPPTLPRLLVLKTNEGNLALQVDGVEGIRPWAQDIEPSDPETDGTRTQPTELTLQGLLEKLEILAA